MSSTQRRVVITGIGVISPIGSTKETLWESLSQGKSGVKALTPPLADGLPVTAAGPVDDFQGKIDSFGPLEKGQKKAIRKGLKVMCRECQMGVAAAQLALHDAELSIGQADPTRTGITFGSDYMLSDPGEFTEGVLNSLSEDGLFDFSRWAPQGMPKMSPLWLLKYLPNMPASHLAIYNDLRGPNNSLTIREAAACSAVGEAYQTILRGSADTMIAGATGTRLHSMKMIHATQQEELASGELPPSGLSRPFDRDRTGAVLGEGAGAIVLEELSSATQRGATIYGEIVASASSSVVGHQMTANREKAVKNAVQSALLSIDFKPREVGHFNAHGLGTQSCDAEEAAAIDAVFGDRSTAIPVVAAKSYFGNLGAGSGMVELAASLLALQHDRLFRVLNYETPDPKCPVTPVTEGCVPPGDSFVAVNVTPQGQAAALLVRRLT